MQLNKTHFEFGLHGLCVCVSSLQLFVDVVGFVVMLYDGQTC